MKKAIFPIIGAILLPVIIVQKVNPNIELVGLGIAVAIGLGVGAGINKIFFK